MNERQERGNKSAIHERQRPELLVDRIPFALEKELQSEGVPRQSRPADQLVNNHANQRKHAQPASQHGKVEDAIGDVAVSGLEERLGLDLRTGRNLWFCNGLRSCQSWRS